MVRLFILWVFILRIRRAGTRGVRGGDASPCDKAMKIWVNGTMNEFTDRLTISGLLKELAVQSEQAAVELNLAILDRADYAKTVLKDGDKLEIIRFVGGG